ncbi:MAG TPA: hypothetical protein VF592_03580 [Sphingomonas sp.]|jgi:hypothetical protein|uniref:hypothetical protein n=1 Tax=Sphingomonas sp. TaxID=28214 RepID=UPI002ED7C11B
MGRADHQGREGGWCILRTSGPRTLALARSLAAAGFEVWTPARTFRRVLQKGRKGERKVQVDAPILPTFVFARASHLSALAYAAAEPVSPHPPFSIFRHGGRIPLVNGSDVAGLRDEEGRAAEAWRALLDADTREEAQRIRIAALKTERARRKAQRAERRTFQPGDQVDIGEMPAFTGKIGTVIKGDGRSALVDFGGAFPMRIEAWRLSPHDVQEENIAAQAAAGLVDLGLRALALPDHTDRRAPRSGGQAKL